MPRPFTDKHAQREAGTPVPRGASLVVEAGRDLRLPCLEAFRLGHEMVRGSTAYSEESEEGETKGAAR